MGQWTWYSRQSKEDQTQRISKSIFVTNFPDKTSAKELWEICEGYGKLIDVYIPNKKSKAGKRFGFVRFINVSDVDLLIGNLCTVWIGRMHLHANEVQFNRASKPFSSIPNSNANVNKVRAAVTFASIAKGPHVLPQTPNVPALVLDVAWGYWILMELDSDLAKSKFLNHIGVASWFEELKNASNEFICRDRIIWVDIEGIPMKAWTKESFAKIATKWGSMMDIEDSVDVTFARKRLCILTKQEFNILEKFKVIIQGKVFMVRAKELYAWTLIFKEEPKSECYSDNESIQGVENLEEGLKHDDNSVEDEDELDAISETDLENEAFLSTLEKHQPDNEHEPTISEDPFLIYKTLKNIDQEQKSQSDQSVPFPPGFTPIDIKQTREKESHVVSSPQKAHPEGLNKLECK
nr:RNA-directed DNA polymerase, eukaryota, nucleotide-binding alpha-beta plait domain protein [Tanacetum cinerariifolium]